MTLQSIDIGPAPLIPGFRLQDLEAGGGLKIRAATAGNGPALLLLHGHPQTHVSWRKAAPRLAQRFSVVACDLRGYGDSSKPEGGGDHAAFSKRVMAADAHVRLGMPLLALWGAQGTVGALHDVLQTWREKATDVRGRAVDCGHCLQEEPPEELLKELFDFLEP
jgi:pimeloyl-ACP methyl ester carboxylesterase